MDSVDPNNDSWSKTQKGLSDILTQTYPKHRTPRKPSTEDYLTKLRNNRARENYQIFKNNKRIINKVDVYFLRKYFIGWNKTRKSKETTLNNLNHLADNIQLIKIENIESRDTLNRYKQI